MAYRDENGKITIDDVAAGEDIRKIERAQAILQNATAEPESSADRRGKFERPDGTGYL